MRRANAALIGGIIVTVVILFILIPLFYNIVYMQGEAAKKQVEVGSFQAERMAEKLQISWLPSSDSRAPAFWANNTGTVTITIKLIALIDSGSGRALYLVNLTSFAPGEDKPIRAIWRYPGGHQLPYGRITLAPGEAALIAINDNLMPSSRSISPVLLSERGVLHPLGGRGATTGGDGGEGSGWQRLIELRDVIISSDILYRFPDYFNNDPERGMTGYDSSGSRYRYVLVDRNIIGDFVINFNSMIVGRKPDNPSKFNILMTFYMGGAYYRAKIEGFSPAGNFDFQYTSYNINGHIERKKVTMSNINSLPGVYLYAEPGASYVRLVGTAERVRVFQRVSATGNALSSYEPYMLFADIDSNGSPELIFSTVDRLPGSYSAVPETCQLDEGGSHYDRSARRTSSGIVTDMEWGFSFRLQRPVMNPAEHAAVLVLVRLAFHDTDMGDLLCIEDASRPIFKLMLVTADWQVVSEKYFTYQDLTPLENTWPFTLTYFTVSHIFYVPPTVSGPLYMAISALDPYHEVILPGLHAGKNDADFLFIVEPIAVTFFSR